MNDITRFTPRGIIAFVLSCLSGVLGISAVAWYGLAELNKGEASDHAARRTGGAETMVVDPTSTNTKTESLDSVVASPAPATAPDVVEVTSGSGGGGGLRARHREGPEQGAW